PAHREREHLRDHDYDPVSGDRAAGLGDLTVKSVDVTPGDGRHLLAPERRADVTIDHAAIVALRLRPLAGKMLVDEPIDQLVDRRGRPCGRDLLQRIMTLVDEPLEPAGLLAGAGGAPIGRVADRIAALAASMGAVVQNESAMAGRSHAHAETADGRVPR